MASSIEIPFRIFIDEFFWSDLITSGEGIDLLKKLSDFHKFSKIHPLCHNIMFDNSFKSAIKKNKTPGATFLGACHPVEVPDFLKSEKNFESQVIRYTINMANKNPFKVYIFTSSAQKTKYSTNEHYKNSNVSEVILLMDFSEAKHLINLAHELLVSKIL